MKKVLFVFFLALSSISFGQSLLEQLNNSVERADGGSGAIVEYQVYLTPSNVKVFYAADWEKGELIGGVEDAEFFELSRTKNGEREAMIINIESAAYFELEISDHKGKTKFKYKFYY